ncbi:MAG: endolytic transglycosylase MltG [Rhodoferax sp.]
MLFSRSLLLALLIVLAGLLGGALLWWLHAPLGQPGQTLDLVVEPGHGAQQVARSAVQAGARVQPTLLAWWFRLSGRARAIKAGVYEIEPGLSPLGLLDKLVAGDQALRSLTLVEGWTFRQIRAALDRAPGLRHDSATWDDATLMQQLGRKGLHPEGRLFPDTYRFAKGSSDVLVLGNALLAMDRQLAQAWAQRSQPSVLTNADELLVLASIVEKETGAAPDRTRIAAVFHNRLRLGMLLQTDPTVIYGLGERFDGNLRKADLLRDTPYNTYTRAGLPPTPIANPGAAALLAAAQPAASDALYFVARGDGSSQFSATLDEHNRAVNRYQRP